MLATASKDNFAYVYNTREGSLMWRVPGHSNHLQAVQFRQNLLYSIGIDQKLIVTNVQSREVLSVTPNCKYYEDMAMLSDGTLILSGKSSLIIHSDPAQPVIDLEDTVTSITASPTTPHLLANLSFTKPSILLLEH
jgi:WD40 repeat protein